MKKVREYIYEEFRENSDPIEDLGVGYDWRVITKGTQLPDDFVTDDGYINRKNYIIEKGYSDDPHWEDEYRSSMITLEMIGATILGSKNYVPFRYRRRKASDKPWEEENTYGYKLYKNIVKSQELFNKK